MNFIKSSLMAICLLLISASNAFSQQAPAIQACFYESTVIRAILANEGCTAIRVYPVADIQGNKLSMMIIGIDKDGKELSSEIIPKFKYILFKGVASGNVRYNPLNSNNARNACNGYSQGNFPKFTAVFQKAALNTLIDGNGGIRISQTYSDDLNSFEASGASLQGDEFPPVTHPVPGDPCPHMCGNSANYVCPVN